MSAPDREAVQDHYPEEFAHCYGCGRSNEAGYKLKTYVEGDETIAEFQPKPEHIALPGFVYGGLIASLADCHAMATAAAAAERGEGRLIGEAPAPRFVTAALNISFLRPTPLGPRLELRGRVVTMSARRAMVQVEVWAEGKETARAEITAVRAPETMLESAKG